MVAILVAAMCALIRKNGGFTVPLRAISQNLPRKKGGQLGVGILVALLDIATANNTVAIVMANPIAKQMSEDYGITHGKRHRSSIPSLHLTGHPAVRRADTRGDFRGA